MTVINIKLLDENDKGIDGTAVSIITTGGSLTVDCPMPDGTDCEGCAGLCVGDQRRQ